MCKLRCNLTQMYNSCVTLLTLCCSYQSHQKDISLLLNSRWANTFVVVAHWTDWVLSFQILSLQAEEAQKESQVEEYERELSRARWRLRKLREEVKQAKRKVEEAGERNSPLQDSIRQSYEEILQVQRSLQGCLSASVHKVFISMISILLISHIP